MESVLRENLSDGLIDIPSHPLKTGWLVRSSNETGLRHWDKYSTQNATMYINGSLITRRNDIYNDYNNTALICNGRFYFELENDSIPAACKPISMISEQMVAQLDFGAKVWQNVTALLSEDREEAALIYLYKSLVDELANTTACNTFLKISMDQTMSSDVIVHILNALSPIRFKLDYWKDFQQYAEKSLEKEVGTETAKQLLKVIV
jgi:hypothetical protein